MAVVFLPWSLAFSCATSPLARIRASIARRLRANVALRCSRGIMMHSRNRACRGRPWQPDRTARNSSTAHETSPRSSRARAAQKIFERSTQAQLDEAATAAGWAIMNPAHNRALAELAVKDTGLGVVADKVARTTARRSACCAICRARNPPASSPSIPSEGITEIARPVGVVAAVVPSTNPGGDARQQHHQRAEVRQRRHRRALPQGPQHLRAAAEVRERGAEAHRRAGRPGAAPAGAGHAGADHTS